MVKHIKKLTYHIAVLFATLFTFSIVLSGFAQAQSSSCNYTAKLTADKLSATLADQVKLTASATVGGLSSQCSQAAFFYLYLKTKANPNGEKINSQLVNFQNTSGTSYTFTVNLADYANQLPVANQYVFYTSLIYGTAVNAKVTSPQVTVSVSGSIGSKGAIKLDMLFVPEQGPYNDGDNVTVSVISNNISDINTSIQSIYWVLKVNGQKIYDVTQDRSDQLNFGAFRYTKMVINSSNNFHNNLNSVQVSLWEANTSNELGEANATLVANSLSGSGGASISFNPSDSSVAPGQAITVVANNFPSDATVSVTATPSSGKKQSGDLNSFDNWQKTFTFNDEGTVQFNFITTSGFQYAKNITISKSAGSNGGTSNSIVNPTFKCDAPNADKDPNYPLYCIVNPLPVNGLTDIVLLIMRGFLFIVAIWAVLFIIIGGFQMVTAAGNEEGYLKARKTVTWAIIGLVIAMLSFSIVAIVQNFIGASAPVIPPAEQQK